MIKLRLSSERPGSGWIGLTSSTVREALTHAVQIHVSRKFSQFYTFIFLWLFQVTSFRKLTGIDIIIYYVTFDEKKWRGLLAAKVFKLKSVSDKKIKYFFGYEKSVMGFSQPILLTVRLWHSVAFRLFKIYHPFL